MERSGSVPTGLTSWILLQRTEKGQGGGRRQGDGEGEGKGERRGVGGQEESENKIKRNREGLRRNTKTDHKLENAR